ncbi:MAG: hypothetical protein NVS1B2_10860 [Vulcanimicrobiaceae bacterium]
MIRIASAARRFGMTLAIVAGAVAAAPPVGAQTSAGSFALLPLVAGDTGVPYQVFASKSERTQYGNSISAGIRRANGGTPIAADRIARALTRAGIDQESPYRACDEASCARSIGRSVGADSVVFGSVTRALSMIWGSQVSIVDVATGRGRGPYDLGYKGDFLTLETGVGELARAVSNRLIADAAERNRTRAMARR